MIQNSSSPIAKPQWPKIFQGQYSSEISALSLDKADLLHSSFWDGDSVSGPAAIRINRAEQKAYFYKGTQLVGVAPISSGNVPPFVSHKTIIVAPACAAD